MPRAITGVIFPHEELACGLVPVYIDRSQTQIIARPWVPDWFAEAVFTAWGFVVSVSGADPGTLEFPILITGEI